MELIVLADAVPRRRDGAVLMSDKTLSGMAAYARHWPGQVTMVGRAVEDDVSGNLGTSWVDPGDLAFRLELGPDPVAVVRDRTGPGVTMAGLDPAHAPLLRGTRPVLLVAENTPANQALYTELSRDRPVPVDQVRVRLGALRRHARQVVMVRRAAGLQCNGWPVWDAYARHSPSPMRYLDSRIEDAHLERAREREPGTGAPLRLAFSGRWVRPKGVLEVVALAHELRRRGVTATLEVIGAGPLDGVLRERAGDLVRFRDPLPFDPDWSAHVTERVDVMVLPHLQADPSGSYLEALACGAPVLAFANDYAVRLAGESRAVWTVPMADVSALADRVEHLIADPDELARARRCGLAFMSQHLFDDEFRRRTEHAVETAGRARDRRVQGP